MRSYSDDPGLSLCKKVFENGVLIRETKDSWTTTLLGESFELSSWYLAGV